MFSFKLTLVHFVLNCIIDMPQKYVYGIFVVQPILFITLEVAIA